jgi:hypothetical protein
MPERAASSPPPEQHWATRNLAYQDCNLCHILGPKKKEVLIYCVYHQSRMNVHLNVDGLRQGLSFMQESGTGDHSGAESTALANESEHDDGETSLSLVFCFCSFIRCGAKRVARSTNKSRKRYLFVRQSSSV